MNEIDDVLTFLAPHMRFITYLIVSRSYSELTILSKRIKEGIKSGKVIFYPEDPSLNIDLEKLRKEKGEKWVSLLIDQLNYLSKLASDFK